MTDRSPDVRPEPGTLAQSDTDAAGRPRNRPWLLGALIIAVVVTAAGAALNSATLALPGALVAAVTVVAYDKTR